MADQILDKIIRTEYRQKLADWASYAKSNELLGLDIINQIYSSKGNKKVNLMLPKEKISFDTQQSFMKRKNDYSLAEAEEMYRRRQLTTSYQFYHGRSLPKRANFNIFEFKSLQKLNLAKPLTPMAISFVDNWLSSKDKSQYEDYVLACLRSLNSKVQVSNPKSTEMRTNYNWKEDWSLSQPVRMDKIGEDLFAFKPNREAIRRQEERQHKFKEKLLELQKSEFAKQMSIFKDFKIN